jgi:threonine/homoserine/homoserine lactone efflux protein
MTDRLLGFAGVCVLLTFVPGVDTAMVTRSALARGAHAGIQTALGAASGLFVHAAAVALGVSALLARSAAGFEGLRLCGGLTQCALGRGRLRPLLQRPRVRRVQQRIVGRVLVALGARLAADRA